MKVKGNEAILLQACKEAERLIVKARKYFPKSIKNSDKFELENTCATISRALESYGVEE